MSRFLHSLQTKVPILVITGAALLLVVAISADDKKEQSTATKATYLISGLHCPPCSQTVEAALSKTKGIKNVKVDWRTKNATIEFDESQLPAQLLARQIAATPHMMGGNMRYAGWLVLKVPSVKDDAGAKAVQDAASKIAGVKSITLYAAQQSIGIQFDSQGTLTSQQVIDALAQAGITATNY
jgi:copper chaperone CopZ